MIYVIIVIVPFLLLPIYAAYSCYIMDLISDKLEHRRQQKKYKRLKVSDVFSFNRELNEVMKEEFTKRTTLPEDDKQISIDDYIRSRNNE